MSIEKMLKEKVDKNGFIDHPMLSHICDNLYVGMSPFYWPHGHYEFYYIFNFYPYKEYPTHGHQIIHMVQMLDDEAEMIPRDMLIRLARMVNVARKEYPVLIHCQMGVNRSNLLSAMALILEGMEARDAIALLRKQRSPYVLMNRGFEQFLLRFNREL